MARGHFGHLHLSPHPTPKKHLEGGERTHISPRSLNAFGSALGWQDTGTVSRTGWKVSAAPSDVILHFCGVLSADSWGFSAAPQPLNLAIRRRPVFAAVTA